MISYFYKKIFKHALVYIEYRWLKGILLFSSISPSILSSTHYKIFHTLVLKRMYLLKVKHFRGYYLLLPIKLFGVFKKKKLINHYIPSNNEISLSMYLSFYLFRCTNVFFKNKLFFFEWIYLQMMNKYIYFYMFYWCFSIIIIMINYIIIIIIILPWVPSRISIWNIQAPLSHSLPFSFLVFSPLLRLSPPPGDHDYIYNLDETEGLCDLFDVPIANLWPPYARDESSTCI